MKSVKPGRGPSMMGGVMSIFMGIFGVIWTVIAFNSAGLLFALFGIIFVVIAVIQAIYNFRNATSEDRYSVYDVTDASEESDPWNERFGAEKEERGESRAPHSLSKNRLTVVF